MNITTGLSLPLSKNGKLNKRLTSYAADKFSILAVSDEWIVTRDTSNSQISLLAKDGTIRKYSNTYSEAYETNILIFSDKMIVLSAEASSIYATVINLLNGNILKKIFLVKDDTPVDPSIIFDQVNNRAIIYSSRPYAGIGWIFSINLSNLIMSTLYLEYANPLLDYITVHLDITSSGVVYRSFVRTDLNQRDISRLTITSSNLDGQIFDFNCPKTVIFANPGLFLYYPKFVNNIIYVFNESETQIIGYATNFANTIAILPITVDTRARLGSGVMYPRFQYDISTNRLYDTRTYFTWDINSGTQVLNEYNICIDGEISTQSSLISNLDVSQPCRIFSQTSKTAFYRINNQNLIYTLDEDLVCELAGQIEQAYQQFQAKSLAKPFKSNILSLNGFKEEFVYSSAKAIFANEIFSVLAKDLNIIINQQVHAIGGSLHNFCKINYNDKFLVRTFNSFRIYDEDGNQILNLSAMNITNQNYCYIFNNRFTVFHSSGVSSLDLLTNTITEAIINYTGNQNNIRVFVNTFTKELNLYIRSQPNTLRKVNYEPIYLDLTDSAVLLNNTEIITTSMPSSTPKTAASEYWGMTWLDPQRLLYSDYSNNLYEKIENLTESVSFGNISTNMTALEPGPTITVLGDLIFDKNARDIINIRNNVLKPRTSIKLEASVLQDEQIFLPYSSDTELKALVSNPISADLYLFERRTATQLAVNYEENKLKFILLSADFGDIIEIAELSSEEIEDYSITPDIKNLDIDTFNNGLKVSSSDSAEILNNFNLTLILNSDELRKVLLIYYKQVNQTSSTGFFELLFADTVIEQSIQNVNRKNIISNGKNYHRYSIIIETLQWSWFSDEKYRINLSFKEVSKYNGDL